MMEVLIALKAALSVQGYDLKDLLIVQIDRSADHGPQCVTVSTVNLLEVLGHISVHPRDIYLELHDLIVSKLQEGLVEIVFADIVGPAAACVDDVEFSMGGTLEADRNRAQV